MLLMRSILCFILATFVAAPAAEATVVSYNFTASITQLAEYDAPLYNSRTVTHANVWGYTIESSQTISGMLRYDSLAPVSSTHESGRYLAYLSSTQAPAISFTFSGGPSFQTSSPLSVQVGNNASALGGADIFYGHASAELDLTRAMGASIALWDNSGMALDSAVMPMSMEGFPMRELRATWGRSDGFLGLVASLTAWTQVVDAPASVPEPSSLLLAIVGLCMAARVGQGASGRALRS